jgi:hypothetical protein
MEATGMKEETGLGYTDTSEISRDELEKAHKHTKVHPYT